jgi:hypothetical protein
MDAEFSEFSYGFSITREITGGKFGSLSAAPVFPSQYAEGRSGGYDVGVPLQGIPLFLQFKLSHHLERSNASEWDVFGYAYYRMYLRPLRHSDQHLLLTDLENQGKAVYYVAPRFHTVEELNNAYSTGRVLDKSAFFRPSDIDLGSPPDIDEHYVAFGESGSPAFVCSNKPRAIRSSYTGSEVAEASRKRLQDTVAKVNRVFFEDVSDGIIDILERRAKETGTLKDLQNRLKQQEAQVKEKGEFVAYLARVFFDAELFVVREGA